MSTADAIRAAAAVVRGERFCDGLIGKAIADGALQAIMTSLAAWFQAQHNTSGG